MIKPEELRIGNWVNYIGGIDPKWSPPIGFTKIESIGDAWINEEDGEYPEDGQTAISLTFCDGIKLTDEILIKCGFTKEEDKNGQKFSLYIDKYDFLYFIPKEIPFGTYYFKIYLDDLLGVRLWTDVQYSIGTLVNKIEYLHQLQNLYFSITGDEIVYKQAMSIFTQNNSLE